MTDFPQVQGHFIPTGTINTFGSTCFLSDGNLINYSPASAAWPAANRAIYIPFCVERSCTAYQMAWHNGATLSGNVDVGIYDINGNALVRLGGTGQTGTSVMQAANITDTNLVPGTYYAGMACDNSTAQFIRIVTNLGGWLRVRGLQAQASAYVLPDPATFAAYTGGYLPSLSISFNSVI